MDMRGKYGDVTRCLSRFSEGPFKRKRVIILILSSLLVFMYILPRFLRIFGAGTSDYLTAIDTCQSNFLSRHDQSLQNYDAYKRIENGAYLALLDKNYLPYVGNGYFGIALEEDPVLNIKYGRTLSIQVAYQPFYTVTTSGMQETTVVNYKKGLLHRYQCGEAVQISYQYYAHRTIPSLFVQEILLSNPSDKTINLKFTIPSYSSWLTAVSHTMMLSSGLQDKSFEVITGMVEIPGTDNVIGVSIVAEKLAQHLSIPAKDSKNIIHFTTIHYSEPVSKKEYANLQSSIERAAIAQMEKVFSYWSDKSNLRKLLDNHVRVWDSLWYTGLYISESKAAGAINGDKINATIYAVLSQVRSPEYEENISSSQKKDIVKSLTYSEGCYSSHSTLEAENLWKPIDTLINLNSVVAWWMLTLEKQGCHNLITAGASGVNQAMVLSFGSFRFSNQHLEYNNHPSNLHRDFLFRRINYGNMTHVNISVVVQEDNKAVLFVALDRSDRNYYACDAGCLDTPVQLGQYRKYFPVKLTEPVTSILYITSDKQHMEELRHALHLKKVVEAPAHEDHIIALHKHGNLGGLPPIFWVTISFLIIMFHVFLIRIVMTEYCENKGGYRKLYNKPR